MAQLPPLPAYPEGGLVFTNTYTSSGTLYLTGTKAMLGRGLIVEDIYTFTVKDGDTVVATGANNGTDTITFTPINYSLDDLARGLITLTVTEDASAVPGVIADQNSYDVTVNLTDNGYGKIIATPTYPEGGLVFTNIYATSGPLVLGGDKVMLGRDLTAEDKYTFTVKEGDAVVATGANNGTSIITFTHIDYVQDDLVRSPITLIVTEDAGTVANVTTDRNSYEVKVSLKDNGDGTITAIPTYPDKAGLVFTNTYSASGTLVLNGEKVMQGRDLTEEDKYTFTVKEGDKLVATGANNGTGIITFTPIDYDQDDLARGLITLTVTEDLSTVDDVVADPNSYVVMVALTDNGDGTITATPTYPESGLVFTNKLTIIPDVSGVTEVETTKTDSAIPRTGESSECYQWVALILLSAGGLLYVLRKKRISKQKE